MTKASHKEIEISIATSAIATVASDNADLCTHLRRRRRDRHIMSFYYPQRPSWCMHACYDNANANARVVL